MVFVKNISMSSLLILATISSSVIHASELTETYSCDTCDYADAQNIAHQEFKPLSCSMENTNENPEFGTTTYVCDTTHRTIMVANPITQNVYKFEISATNHNEFTDAPNVTVSESTPNSAEQQAINTFFLIDAEFRNNAANFSIDTSQNSTSQHYTAGLSQSKQAMHFAGMRVTSSTADSCTNHPSNFLTGLTAQRDIRRDLAQGLAAKIGNQSWDDVYTDTRMTGFGFNISASGGGAQLNWEYNSLNAFVTRSYGNSDNKLVFRVVYQGDALVGGARDLNFAMELQKGSSMVDGIPIGTFMSGNSNDLKDVTVSNCLIENLAETADVDLAWESGTVDSGSSSPYIPSGSYGGSCTREIKYTTCSTTTDGVQTCTESSVQTNC